MTAEQEKQVEEIKNRAWEYINYGFIGERNGEQSAVDRATLLAIVDDLRKQLDEAQSYSRNIALGRIIPKAEKYTEHELLLAFNAVPFEKLFPKGQHGEGLAALSGWCQCAKWLGVVKE
jgi:hypothetical protein